ncbi:MAG TPA: cation-transporting P-type ATPase [Egibacteraceae bacterium]|nr:cation-transporting P-type ATPase [Egibacteraceae bacterium]
MQHRSTLASPHAASAAAVAVALEVDPSVGLASAEATDRLALHGPNELIARRRPSLLAMLWNGVTEPFVALLLIAGLLAVAVGEVRDGLLVLVGLVPIVGADVVTGYRGERALEALRESAAPMATLRRGGTVVEAPAAQVVPGDIVLIAVGDVVPADLRLTSADALLIDRAVLTGESVPEPGSTEPDDREAPIVDQHAMAFAGTRVVQGRGEGVVVATGPRSRLGRIASALGGEERRRSPVQLELDRLVRILLTVAVGLIVITSGLALLRGEPIGVALLAGVAAAIAAIPEEPPILLAVILGLGAYRLLRRGVLVRRLNAQETLSAVDLILTDKTGTLTFNELSLEAAFTPHGELSDGEMLEVARLALRAQDDAWYRSRGSRAGSFTRALEGAAAAGGDAPLLDPVLLIEAEPASGAHPFTRTVARREGGGRQELVLGAPEAVLDVLAGVDDAPQWHALVERHADAGRRLLLLAAAEGDRPLQPVALLSFSDPLRPDVGDALSAATDAGIQTVVVTGDHPLTAGRIARAAGLSEGTSVTGDELAEWDDERLMSELPALRLVARALPEQKLRIVEVARRAGRTVAVTGDGVNDAPALEHADVAVAMGSGSAVAREASDLVLGDDSFSTLMNGLREGRRMVANIQKGLVFLVSTHVALLGFVLIATLYGFSQPLLPIHILWLEFFIDISASIAFEREPEEPDLMHQPPRPRGQPLLTRELLLRISGAGAWTAVGALVLIATLPGGLDHARWVAFNALVVGQVVRAYANRSLTRPVLTLRRNSVLLGAALVALAAQFAIPYVPLLADTFRAAPLSALEWLLVAVIALAPAILAESVRALRGRTWVA